MREFANGLLAILTWEPGQTRAVWIAKAGDARQVLREQLRRASAAFHNERTGGWRTLLGPSRQPALSTIDLVRWGLLLAAMRELGPLEPGQARDAICLATTEAYRRDEDGGPLVRWMLSEAGNAPSPERMAALRTQLADNPCSELTGRTGSVAAPASVEEVLRMLTR